MDKRKLNDFLFGKENVDTHDFAREVEKDSGLREGLRGLEEMDMSEELLSLFGGSSLILGLFLLVISIGFFRGWSIFWYLGVIVTVISLLLSAATVLSGSMGSVIPTLVLLIVLLYLFKRNVKDFFLG